MKKILFLTMFVLVFLAGEDASAHATPTSYLPVASSVLEVGQLPREVIIEFTERVEPTASSLIIYAPDGSEVGEKAVVDSSDAHILKASIKEAGNGTYAVSWQVVSADDGHFTKGGFVFSVGQETQIAGAVGPQTQVSIIHLSTVSEGMTIWVELLGQALLIGVFGMYLFMRQYGKTIPANRLNLSIILGVGLTVTGALLYFFANSMSLADAQKITLNESLIKFAGTVSGSFALYRAATAVMLLIVFWFSRKSMMVKEKISVGEVVAIILILAMVAMRARVSHASASHFYPQLAVAMNFVHLLFKELWIGGLIAAAIFLPALKRTIGFDSRKFFLQFSKMASFAITIAGPTGFYIIWLHLKDPKYITTTDWGSRFIALSVAAGVFIILRLFHQIFVEYKQKGTGLLRWSFPLETLIGITVLLFTSFLIITTPPVEQTVFERSVSSQGTVISILDHQQNHFRVDVKNEDNSPPAVSNLVVTIFNDEKSIGPILVTADKVSDGQYFIDQKSFSPSGEWRIEISAQRAQGYDANAVFTINYPQDIVSLAQIPEKRFGSFEMLSIAGAIIVLIISIYLYRLSNNLLILNNESPQSKI